MSRAEPSALRGGDVESNVNAIRSVLSGEAGPHRDIVVLNAAAGLVAAGTVADIAEGLSLAAGAVDNGRAAHALDELVEISNS